MADDTQRCSPRPPPIIASRPEYAILAKEGFKTSNYCGKMRLDKRVLGGGAVVVKKLLHDDDMPSDNLYAQVSHYSVHIHCWERSDTLW